MRGERDNDGPRWPWEPPTPPLGPEQPQSFPNAQGDVEAALRLLELSTGSRTGPGRQLNTNDLGDAWRLHRGEYRVVW